MRVGPSSRAAREEGFNPPKRSVEAAAGAEEFEIEGGGIGSAGGGSGADKGVAGRAPEGGEAAGVDIGDTGGTVGSVWSGGGAESGGFGPEGGDGIGGRNGGVTSRAVSEVGGASAGWERARGGNREVCRGPLEVSEVVAPVDRVVRRDGAVGRVLPERRLRALLSAMLSKQRD